MNKIGWLGIVDNKQIIVWRAIALDVSDRYNIFISSANSKRRNRQ
ncbi:hypothetical protein [Chroococcidiopsis sp.]